MHEDGTATVDPDIKPFSETDRLADRLPAEDDLQREIDFCLASAVLGMSSAYIGRALGRPGTRPRTLTLGQIIDLLDVDGYQETFVRRSQVPHYLLDQATNTTTPAIDGRTQVEPQVAHGNARDLLRRLVPGSVQTVVTSTPYWGMRIYENTRPVKWADGAHCVYGFEQTPESFIRHSVELLYLLRPALTADGSVWWNVMDTYNTRTPIRGSASQRLTAMGGTRESQKGWTEHEACRHSAGHMYLNDGEQCSIPARIAERASRIGYRLISCITWNKHNSSPEPVRNRVTRNAEYILHLSPGTKPPLFRKDAWKELNPEDGGPSKFESKDRITDVWALPVAKGRDGHGAAFPPALASRCITLSSNAGDVVLDPFVGSGTTALVADRLQRRCVAFDISDKYVELTRSRLRDSAGKVKPVRLSPGQLEFPSETPATPAAEADAADQAPRAPAVEPPVRAPGRRRVSSALVPASPSIF
jgi:DNA modification methylase